MRAVSLALGLWLAASVPTLACVVTHELSPERADAQDFVVGGRVVEYIPNAWEGLPGSTRYVLVRMEVSTVWKGDVGESFDFVLTGNIMLNRQSPDGIIIAAKKPDRASNAGTQSIPEAHQNLCELIFAQINEESLDAFNSWFAAEH